jgi:hypothetical protein
MSELIDDAQDENPEDTIAWFDHQSKTTGIRAAFLALVGVCTDTKAQASARATAGGWLLRASGILDRGENGAGKDPDQMTAAELGRERVRLEKMIASAKRVADDVGADVSPPARGRGKAKGEKANDDTAASSGSGGVFD